MLLLFALVGCSMRNNATPTPTTTHTTSKGNVTENVTVKDQHKNNLTNRADMNTQITIADDAADRIAALNEVESANVLVTNNNAYVGVKLKKGIHETEALKKKIDDAVRQTNAGFSNVYVSANPDFATQMQDYRDKVRAGEPVEGFFEQFTDAMNRMFPHAK